MTVTGCCYGKSRKYHRFFFVLWKFWRRILAPLMKMEIVKKILMAGINSGHHNLLHMKFRWNRTMLNLCGIVVAILKMTTGRNFSMSGNCSMSGHHYLPTYQILMISDNVEFLPPIFYTVFWQTSRNFENAELLL